MLKRGFGECFKKLMRLAGMSVFLIAPFTITAEPRTEGLPLLYWQEEPFINFGDYISKVLVERIVQTPLRCYLKRTKNTEKKMLAVGSILYFANQNDVIWGSGTNGKQKDKSKYLFTELDIRAVRGPLTRAFLKDTFDIDAPEVYGDPALLFPYFFPEFKKKENPSRDYIVIPHYSERKLITKEDPHVVFPTDPWDEVLEQILDSKLVIASSLHGIIMAEAYGIPARMVRFTDNEPLLKYIDYYFSTNRPDFQYATSIDEAVRMGGEKPYECDLKALYEAFPFEFWPDTTFNHPDFQRGVIQ